MVDLKKYNGSTWVDTTLRQYKTATADIEPTIYTDGTAITAYTLKGNTVQNGTPTPTSPIAVNGVGELVGSDYKIPISSANTTTPVYLGEVESTRQIKKYVVTGNETISNYDYDYQRFLLTIPTIPSIGTRLTPIICTHYIGIYDGRPIAQVPMYAVYTGSDTDNSILIKTDQTTDRSTFISWLQEKYANGTPVTIWYAVSTAETAAVNEPLMKIGTYADTLSNAASIPTTEGANSITVDTIVQPSEFTATWTGWHDATVEEYVGGVGLNKFLPPLEAISETINGVTFTVNTNGTVTIDGTASAAANFKYRLKGDMVVPTSKQMGGDAYMYFWNDFTSGGTIRFLYNDTMVDYWSTNPVNRVLSKFDNLENQTINTVEIRIPSGETRHNATLSLMLTNDGEQAAAYEPYEYAWV